MFELWKGMRLSFNHLYSIELIIAAASIATLFCSYAHYWVIKEIIITFRKRNTISPVIKVGLFSLCLAAMIIFTGLSDGYHGSTILAIFSRHFRFISYHGCPFIAGAMAYNLFRKTKDQKDQDIGAGKCLYWISAIILILAAIFVVIGTFPVPSRH